MQLKKNSIRSLFSSITLLSMISLTTGLTSASLQTQSMDLIPVPSSSPLAAQLTGENTFSYVDPISSTQTPVTPENEGHFSGWSFSPYDSLPCEQATPQSLHIRASNDLSTEGSPDWSAMVLASYDNSYNVVTLTPNRPVIEGYSPDPIPIFVGRWSHGSEAFPPATSEWGIGIEGPMEAIWDISSLANTDQLALGVGHDAEDGTTGLQTTIESVVVTYDTTACSPQDAPATVSSTTTTATPPKTGQVINLVILLSILGASIVLLVKTARHLKAKH